MSNKIGGQKRKALIRDIFNATHDVVALAEAHGLTPARLAEWISDPENQRCLSGLCVLADMQTQLMLSRYRLVAVTKLIQQATQQEDVSAEQARKACADLLKLELTRVGPSDLTSDEARAGEAMTPEALRRMLYSESASTGDTPSDA